jgi:lysozyme family protein
MAIGNFARCIDFTLREEGGFSDDRLDPGNWTGGAVGCGVFGGTNFGISAASYPTLNLRALTSTGASTIYQRDYWTPLKCDSFKAGVDLVMMDFSVNAGLHRSAVWLQDVVHTDQDGKIGPATIAAANEFDAATLISILTAAHEHFYETMRDAARYAKALDGRAERCQAAALAML